MRVNPVKKRRSDSMFRKASYFIEFRFQGYAKRYSKKIIWDVAKKFRVKGVTEKKLFPI